MVFFPVIFHGPRLMAVGMRGGAAQQQFWEMIPGPAWWWQESNFFLFPDFPTFYSFILVKKKEEDVPRFAAVWGLSCDLINDVSEIFQSHRAALQTQHCHTPPCPTQNSHWAFLSILTPKHPKNPCKEHDPNPDLIYMNWEL